MFIQNCKGKIKISTNNLRANIHKHGYEAEATAPGRLTQHQKHSVINWYQRMITLTSSQHGPQTSLREYPNGQCQEETKPADESDGWDFP
ncbi:hypothetical protein N7486_009238 [Penicillium sp. IBT 16267x]|nr:hypothetical protein N7486_009238 [Penicillium sp. IBT 16267x]